MNTKYLYKRQLHELHKFLIVFNSNTSFLGNDAP